MLSWFMRGDRSEGDVDSSDPHKDAPDTPAPLFVARAFKTALFGTPAPTERPESEFESEIKNESQKDKPSSSQPENILYKKPSSILMTPGTATTLRKKVSFGSDVVQKNPITKADPNAKSSSVSQRVNQNPLESNTQLTNPTKRKTALTHQLERAREQKPSSEGIEKTTLTKNSTDIKERVCYESHSENREIGDNAGKHMTDACEESDTTMDLNKPLSQSGKYWKAEFENYHQEARLEMRKLLSYKELAKSLAKIKDERSTILAEKLKEEQQKVISMEETMTKLSAKLWATDARGVERFDDESRILIKELARQTARAVQYKEQVEEFRELMENLEPYYSKTEQEGRVDNAHPGMEHHVNVGTSILLSQIKRENKELAQKIKETIPLKEENEKLLVKTRDKDEIIYNLKVEKERLNRKVHQLEAQLTELETKLSGELWSYKEQKFGVEQTHQKPELSVGKYKNENEKQSFKTDSAQRNNLVEAVNSNRLEIEPPKSPNEKGKVVLRSSDDNLPVYDCTERQFQKTIQFSTSTPQKESPDNTQMCNLDEVDKYCLQVATKAINSSRPTNKLDTQIQPIRFDSQSHLSYSQLSDGEVHKINDNLKNHKNIVDNTSSKLTSDNKNLLPETFSIIPVDSDCPQDRVSQRRRSLSIESSIPKPFQPHKNFLEILEKPSTTSNKYKIVERRSAKSPLPPDRIEAAKKRLAEKKRMASALTRSSERYNT